MAFQHLNELHVTFEETNQHTHTHEKKPKEKRRRILTEHDEKKTNAEDLSEHF